MDARRGGQRYCPSCKKIVETRVLLEGYSQEEFHGIPAKKRQIICGTDAEGSNEERSLVSKRAKRVKLLNNFNEKNEFPRIF